MSGCCKVECILELFAVAPTFERLYDSGPTDWRAREVLQSNLDHEAACVAELEHVIDITSLSELQQTNSGRVRRRKVQLTDVSQAQLDEMSTYYGEDRGRRTTEQNVEDFAEMPATGPDDLYGGTGETQAASADGGEVQHQSKLAIVSTIRPKGRYVC